MAGPRRERDATDPAPAPNRLATMTGPVGRRATAGRLWSLQRLAVVACIVAWYSRGGSPWNQVEEKPLKSPFPGMDPYIEACGLWEDFHNHLIEKIGETLADAAPDRYLVRTGERSYIVLLESEGMKTYSFRPDVSVTRPRGRTKAAKKGGTALAVPTGESEPMTLRPSSRRSIAKPSSKSTRRIPVSAW